MNEPIDVLAQMRARNSNPIVNNLRRMDELLQQTARTATGQGDLSVAQFRLYADFSLSAAAKIVTIIPRESQLISLYGDDGFNNYVMPPSLTLDFASGTSGRKHAMYLYVDPIATADTTDNAKIVAEFEAWTNETTRATALESVEGVMLKTGDRSRRWIGDAFYDGTAVFVQGGIDELSGRWYGTGDPNNMSGGTTTGYGFQVPGLLVGSARFNAFVIKADAVAVGLGAELAQFGSNIAAANTTALSIFHIAQTYNGESMAAGASLFGSNSTNMANMLWNPVSNRVEFRGGVTVQAYVDTAGKLSGGGGAIWIDADGLSLSVPTVADDKNTIKFMSGSAKELTIDVSDSGLGAVNASFQLNTDTTGANRSFNNQLSFGTLAKAGTRAMVTLAARAGSLAATTINIKSDDTGVQSVVTINDNGTNTDFQVEGDVDPNMIYGDASTDRVGVGVATPSTKFHVSSAVNTGLSIQSTGTNGIRWEIQSAGSNGSAVDGSLEIIDRSANVARMHFDANGGIGVGTTTPNANTMLDIVSTTKAFMPPRMTTTQRNNIASPTAGMMIYNTTTNKLNVYTTAWEAVTSA